MLTNSQVHEIIAPGTGLINDGLQEGLINTIGNVAEHDLGKVSKYQERVE